jgi:hypothetical protein
MTMMKMAYHIGRKNKMLNKFISIILCKFKGHTLVQAGTCPFTGSTYEYCERCSAMIPIQKAE